MSQNVVTIPDDELAVMAVSPSGAAKMLGVDRATIFRKIKTNQIPVCRMSPTRIPIEAIDRILGSED